MKPDKKRQKRAAQRRVILVGGAYARNDHDVIAAGHLRFMQTVCLPDSAPYAVSHNGLADLGADRNTEPVAFQPVFPTIDSEAGIHR